MAMQHWRKPSTVPLKRMPSARPQPQAPYGAASLWKTLNNKIFPEFRQERHRACHASKSISRESTVENLTRGRHSTFDPRLSTLLALQSLNTQLRKQLSTTFNEAAVSSPVRGDIFVENVEQ
jgi:hypothetical protein